MVGFLRGQLFPLALVLSALLHAGALFVHSSVNFQPAVLIAPEAGVTSISLRSSSAAGPKPSAKGPTTSTQRSRASLEALPPLARQAEKQTAPIKKPSPAPRSTEVVRPKAPEPLSILKPVTQPSPIADPPPPVPSPAMAAEKPSRLPPVPAQPAAKIEDKAKQSPPTSEAVTAISPQVSRPSRGSRGSRGSKVDGLAKGLITNPSPPYPPELLQAHVEGSVTVWMKIDAAGNVTDAHVQQSSGIPAFDDSALTTVKRWRFIPVCRGGEPVPCELVRSIDYIIDRGQ